MSWRELFVKTFESVVKTPIKWSDKRQLLGDIVKLVVSDKRQLLGDIVKLVAAEVYRSGTRPYIRVEIDDPDICIESLWLGNILLIWDIDDFDTLKHYTALVYDESSDRMDFAERGIAQFILDVYSIDVEWVTPRNKEGQ